MKLISAPLLALAAFHAPALAGDVWTVDDDPSADFQSLQVAVESVADGDVLLVGTGSYPPFALQGKGLTIVADTGADARIQGTIQVLNLPANSSVFLRNLRTGSPEGHGLSVRQCQGPVHIEGCQFTGRNLDDGTFDVYSGAFVAGSSQVLFHDCELIGSFGIGVTQFGIPGSAGHGAYVLNSSVTLTASELRGQWGGSAFPGEGSDGGTGGHGLRLVGSQVSVEGCTLIGGAGGDGDADFQPFGGKSCGDGGDGGDAIRLDSIADFGDPPVISSLVLRDNQFQPAPGGFGKCAPSGAPGEPLHVDDALPHSVVQADGSARNVLLPSPVRGGEQALLQTTLAAGDFLVTLISPLQTTLPIAGQVLPLLSGGPELSVNLVGVSPSGGSQFMSLPVPELPAGFGGETIVLQGVVLPLDAVELQLLPATSITLLEQ